MGNQKHIDSDKLVKALKHKLGVNTDGELAAYLGTSTGTLKGWLTNGVTEERLARALVSAVHAGRAAESRKIANDALDSLWERTKAATANQLASKIGVSVGTLSNWSAKGMTGRKLADGLIKAQHCAVTSANAEAISPIVEYYPLAADRRTKDSQPRLFPTGGGSAKVYQGLKEELVNAHGIYIFYDSRGRALYVGKAQRLSLWVEMNSAFNRDRDTQSVFRVAHPSNGQFRTTEEQKRQVQRTKLFLWNMAEYFSAYRVADPLINELEALLVRSFANDLLNVKMERFGK